MEGYRWNRYLEWSCYLYFGSSSLGLGNVLGADPSYLRWVFICPFFLTAGINRMKFTMGGDFVRIHVVKVPRFVGNILLGLLQAAQAFQRSE